MSKYALNVLGRLYPIVGEYLDSELYGMLQNGVITINLRHEDEIQNTLVHEFLHAALERGGVNHALDPKLEEAIVCCLENALMGSGMIKPLVVDFTECE